MLPFFNYSYKEYLPDYFSVCLARNLQNSKVSSNLEIKTRDECASNLLLKSFSCSIIFTKKFKTIMFLLVVNFVEDNPPPKTPESEKNYLPKLPRKCCTIQEVKDRPEIILWYFANMISYLGFFMPFLNLVSQVQITLFRKEETQNYTGISE